MTKKYLLAIFFFFSCWSGPESPAVQTEYNFEDVAYGSASVAYPHENKVFIGSYKSDRIAIFKR